MKINLKKLIPKEWQIEKAGDNKIRVYYLNKGRGSSPKPFILPKMINIDKEFMEAAGMYLGDGKLSKDLVHLGFSSIDMDMIKFILDFFMKRFGILLKDMTISMRFKEFKKETLNEWSKVLKIPISKIKLQNNLRSKNESYEIQISGKIFRIIFGKILKKVMSSDFLLNQELRRAFLRGLFAAEGNIAINYQENYIVCIQYCLGFHENRLAGLIKKALDIESIAYKETKKERDRSLTIRTTNWKNYHKCWRMDLFYLNQRKEFLFLSKLKTTKFSCKLNSDIKEKLFIIKHFSQRQLAFFIGGYSSMLTNNSRKREFINIEYIIQLSKIASVSIDEIKNNIVDFRVNDVTSIKDGKFIDFIFNLKSYCI